MRQIQTYTAGVNRSQFETDRLTQDAVVRNIEILGEASRRVLEALPNATSKFPAIPFAAIYAMRNQVSHGYFSVDSGTVWNVIEKDIPLLRLELEKAVAEFRE